MSKFAASLAVAAVLLSASAIAETAKPTVVLVRGAFADSSSWNGVTRILQRMDTAMSLLRRIRCAVFRVMRLTLSSVVNNIKGPVVLVGHSYGGQVITNAARDTNNVKSLVYITFARTPGEAAADLAEIPGGTLGPGRLPHR